MRNEFATALAVVDDKCLYVLSAENAFCHCFPLDVDVSQNEDPPQVAWALRSPRPFDPIVLVAHQRRIFVCNVRDKKVIGCIRGHGGRITSIVVDPRSPNIFATTSADFTTRIYNLDHKPLEPSENPIWSPWDGPSLGSAAHGTDGSDSTGSGYSHCFQILVGGRSGGHVWDVLGAAFHPHLPLIATCGADRHVKIWRIVSDKNNGVFRDDKPLFSARITTAAVLSIAWLGEDVLLIHTAITRTPHRGENGEEDIVEPGTLDVFQWLGLKRFFPTSSSTVAPTMQGGASDYLESKSYTLLSTRPLTFPGLDEPISTISQPQVLHGYFLIVHPYSTDVILLPVSEFAPKSLPASANDVGDTLADMTKRIRIDSPLPPPSPNAREALPVERLFDSDDLALEVVHVRACALTHSGDVVILGAMGGIWFLSEE
ncbi:Coatomer beta subunit [Mycena sanguinolenta]|uniref:Coatomer beta subunit n=1 Tax=Mycena sanguinolenta TaxID=230812 RepID=A0A8H6XFE9_9AGAR|nr:Coatomer beta subunit [Mycena sanguinolenta]